MNNEVFEALVADGYEQLPLWVREKISNVALLVEEEPSGEDRRLQGLGEDETLLGLYKATPLSSRGFDYGVGATLPDTITIYREPILDAAREECSPGASDDEYRGTVRRLIAETVWHEYAHHFGMNEHEVQERESKRNPPFLL